MKINPFADDDNNDDDENCGIQNKIFKTQKRCDTLKKKR